LTWKGKEVDVYEKMKYLAEQTNNQLPDYVKRVLEKHLKDE